MSGMSGEDGEAGRAGLRPPGDLAFGLAFTGLAALLLALIGRETVWVEGQRLFAQPRFWPAIGLGGMVLFGAVHVLSGLRRQASGAGTEIARWVRAVEFAGWYIGFVWLVPVIGYLPASILVPLLLALRLGYRSAATLGAAVGVGVAAVLFFKAFLGARIPGGAVYDLLPGGLRNFMILYL